MVSSIHSSKKHLYFTYIIYFTSILSFCARFYDSCWDRDYGIKTPRQMTPSQCSEGCASWKCRVLSGPRDSNCYPGGQLPQRREQARWVLKIPSLLTSQKPTIFLPLGTPHNPSPRPRLARGRGLPPSSTPVRKLMKADTKLCFRVLGNS